MSNEREEGPRRGPLPGWLVARGGLRISLEGAHQDFGDALVAPVTRGTRAVLAYTDPREEFLTWLTAGNLSDWHASIDDAQELASRQLDRLLAEAKIERAQLGQHEVAVLKTDSIFKASLLLAPGLRQRVEPLLGWPVHAVAPCRDFVFLFADPDLIPELAGMVAHEYEGSPHALTLEVLRLVDGGLEALGAYAEVTAS